MSLTIITQAATARPRLGIQAPGPDRRSPRGELFTLFFGTSAHAPLPTNSPHTTTTNLSACHLIPWPFVDDPSPLASRYTPAIMKRAPTSAVLGILILFLPGCLQRTLSITTEPPGALVWLNDVEIGITPLETDFTYYGGYDLRIRRPGYEPVVTTQRINPPLHERPVIDLFAEMWPGRIHNRVEWTFALSPSPERGPDSAAAEQEVLARANELRGQLIRQPATTTEASPASKQ